MNRSTRAVLVVIAVVVGLLLSFSGSSVLERFLFTCLEFQSQDVPIRESLPIQNAPIVLTFEMRSMTGLLQHL